MSTLTGARPAAAGRGTPASGGADRALFDLGKALQALGYRFTTPTPATHALINARADNTLAHDLHGIFGWSRRFRPADSGPLPPALLQLLERAGLLLRHADGTASSAVRASTIDCGGAGANPALFFHSAFPTLQENAVFFGPDTYRFLRQLRAAVPALPVTRAVDIGCGSGAGAVLLAHMLPGAAIDAVDINDAALAMTAVNAALAGTTRVRPRRSNLLAGLDGSFDLIIANPPYLVDEHQRSYRHGGGVLGGDLSLAIVDAAIERLAPGGTLLLYTGAAIVRGLDALHDAAAARLDRAGFHWSYEEIDADVFGEELQRAPYAQVERIAAVWLVATKS